jgi:hypothetical protein
MQTNRVIVFMVTFLIDLQPIVCSRDADCRVGISVKTIADNSPLLEVLTLNLLSALRLRFGFYKNCYFLPEIRASAARAWPIS